MVFCISNSHLRLQGEDARLRRFECESVKVQGRRFEVRWILLLLLRLCNFIIWFSHARLRLFPFAWSITYSSMQVSYSPEVCRKLSNVTGTRQTVCCVQLYSMKVYQYFTGLSNICLPVLAKPIKIFILCTPYECNVCHNVHVLSDFLCHLPVCLP